MFKLYHTFYPKIRPSAVTISGSGTLVNISDSTGSFALSLFSGSPCVSVPSFTSAVCSGMVSQFVSDNRRELFMLREARSLYGLVYAENLESDLYFMSLRSGSSLVPRPGFSGVRLSYLFPLCDCITRKRYSLSRITLCSDGNVTLLSSAASGAVWAQIEPGGRVRTSGGLVADANSGSRECDITHYARMFCRDNAVWFANFAAGREERL